MTKPHHRDWGRAGSLFFCLLLFVSLRDRYSFASPEVSYALGLFVVVAFAYALYMAFVDRERENPWPMAVTSSILAALGVLSLAKILYLVLYQPTQIEAVRLIQTSLLIWVSNVVVFAIIYHLLGEREFAFPRAEGAPANQRMNFLDYVFLSYTTATAFSPTDTSPLSTRARMCMMIEATVSLLAIVIAAARAINVLPQ